MLVCDDRRSRGWRNRRRNREFIDCRRGLRGSSRLYGPRRCHRWGLQCWTLRSTEDWIADRQSALLGWSGPGKRWQMQTALMGELESEWWCQADWWNFYIEMQGNEKLNECGKIRPCEKQIFCVFWNITFYKKREKRRCWAELWNFLDNSQVED